MSTSPQDQKDASEIASGDKHPESKWDQYFRFRPIALVQFLLGEIDSAGREKRKRDYYTGVFRKRLPGFFAALFIAVIGGFILHQIGFFNPETVVAVFTVVLSAVAIVQWISSHLQWKAFQVQNRILARQSKQTDAIIKQMRLEQRAWLVIKDVQLVGELTEQKRVHCEATILNVGKTPATVATWMFCTEFRNPEDLEIKIGYRPVEGEPKRFVHGYVRTTDFLDYTDTFGAVSDVTIAPQMPVQKDTDMGGNEACLDGTTLPQVKSGDLKICFLGYVGYAADGSEIDSNVRGKVKCPNNTWCCYIYDPISTKFIMHPSDNHMD